MSCESPGIVEWPATEAFLTITAWNHDVVGLGLRVIVWQSEFVYGCHMHSRCPAWCGLANRSRVDEAIGMPVADHGFGHGSMTFETCSLIWIHSTYQTVMVQISDWSEWQVASHIVSWHLLMPKSAVAQMFHQSASIQRTGMGVARQSRHKEWRW